ncbi:MAG: pyruvate dehydrogenase component, partial [Gaiellales bacterium]|nr:pyruvate dehydrogenase component [Gaiellales bacterium]
MTLHAVAPIDPLPSEPALRSIEQRVLWLAVRMVDYVNRDLPSSDGMKIGGHQASSASLASAMTVLWMCELQRGDRVAVKPHASPVLHALEYLLGWLDERYLRSLRQFGGLQAYPSRTKDPVPVDYSTGSVGLGAAAPLFGALAQRYVRDHLQPDEGGGRFFSILGDAELDEGNIWEAILDPATRGLGEAVWIVDFNRQSLDRVVPVLRSSGLEQAFESAGWRVVELKYGRRLRRVFTEEGGRVLRRVIDQMPNQQYQQLFSAGEDEVTEALERSAGASSRRLRKLLEGHRGQVRELIRDLGGHDLDDLREALASTRGSDRPTVIFAYTIKGHGLPIAGHPLNHSLLLTGDQIDDLRARVGLTEDTEWSRIDADSAAGGLVADAAARL